MSATVSVPAAAPIADPPAPPHAAQPVHKAGCSRCEELQTAAPVSTGKALA